MAVNTAYLGTPGSGNAQSSGASTVLSDLSISGTLDVGPIESTSAVSAGAFTGTSFTATSKFSTVGSGATQFGQYYSGYTTGAGSLTSTVVSDQELSIVSLSITSCILAYRSGNTVYKWFAGQAEGLSTVGG